MCDISLSRWSSIFNHVAKKRGLTSTRTQKWNKNAHAEAPWTLGPHGRNTHTRTRKHSHPEQRIRKHAKFTRKLAHEHCFKDDGAQQQIGALTLGQTTWNCQALLQSTRNVHPSAKFRVQDQSRSPLVHGKSSASCTYRSGMKWLPEKKPKSRTKLNSIWKPTNEIECANIMSSAIASRPQTLKDRNMWLRGEENKMQALQRKNLLATQALVQISQQKHNHNKLYKSTNAELIHVNSQIITPCNTNKQNVLLQAPGKSTNVLINICSQALINSWSQAGQKTTMRWAPWAAIREKCIWRSKCT